MSKKPENFSRLSRVLPDECMRWTKSVMICRARNVKTKRKKKWARLKHFSYWDSNVKNKSLWFCDFSKIEESGQKDINALIIAANWIEFKHN